MSTHELTPDILRNAVRTGAAFRQGRRRRRREVKMLGFGMRYLNGFVAASQPDSYDRPEWPPHPGRIFMALAAAHFETGTDPAERAALEWLEKLEARPHIRAGEASARALVTHFAPVNDKVGPAKAILQAAPALTRDHQARTFARARLGDEVARVCWPDAALPQAIRASLETLWGKSDSNRAPRHAGSDVACLAGRHRRTELGSGPERAEIHLRAAGPGTLEYLERCFNPDEVERGGSSW